MELLGKLKQDFNNGVCSYDVLASICKWFRDTYDINIYGKMASKETGELFYIGVIESFDCKNDKYYVMTMETEQYDTCEEAITAAIKKVLGDE